MIVTKDTRRWKEEQMNYFKKYIRNFKDNSKEYNLIMEGIEELEKHI